MSLGCTDKEHEDRAKRYKFCFICGRQLTGKDPMSLFRHCPNCGEVGHVSWEFCGWCGMRLK